MQTTARTTTCQARQCETVYVLLVPTDPAEPLEVISVANSARAISDALGVTCSTTPPSASCRAAAGSRSTWPPRASRRCRTSLGPRPWQPGSAWWTVTCRPRSSGRCSSSALAEVYVDLAGQDAAFYPPGGPGGRGRARPPRRLPRPGSGGAAVPGRGGPAEGLTLRARPRPGRRTRPVSALVPVQAHVVGQWGSPAVSVDLSDSCHWFCRAIRALV